MSVNLLNLTKRRKTVAPLDAHPAPFNPPIRTSNRSGDIDKLAETLATQGQLEPAHAVEYPDGTLRLVDGHRRRAACLLNGMKLDLFVWNPGSCDADEVVDALYVELNKPKRRLANRDQVETALAGGPIFTKAVKSTVDQLNAIFPKGIPTNVKNGAGSYLLSIAKRTVKYCWPGFNKDQPSFRNKTAIVLLWLVRNTQQQQTVAYMRLGRSPDRLKGAIENDRLVPGMNAE